MSLMISDRCIFCARIVTGQNELPNSKLGQLRIFSMCKLLDLPRIKYQDKFLTVRKCHSCMNRIRQVHEFTQQLEDLERKLEIVKEAVENDLKKSYSESLKRVDTDFTLKFRHELIKELQISSSLEIAAEISDSNDSLDIVYLDPVNSPSSVPSKCQQVDIKTREKISPRKQLLTVRKEPTLPTSRGAVSNKQENLTSKNSSTPPKDVQNPQQLKTYDAKKAQKQRLMSFNPQKPKEEIYLDDCLDIEEDVVEVAVETSENEIIKLPSQSEKHDASSGRSFIQIFHDLKTLRQKNEKKAETTSNLTETALLVQTDHDYIKRPIALQLQLQKINNLKTIPITTENIGTDKFSNDTVVGEEEINLLPIDPDHCYSQLVPGIENQEGDVFEIRQSRSFNEKLPEVKARPVMKVPPVTKAPPVIESLPSVLVVKPPVLEEIQRTGQINSKKVKCVKLFPVPAVGLTNTQILRSVKSLRTSTQIQQQIMTLTYRAKIKQKAHPSSIPSRSQPSSEETRLKMLEITKNPVLLADLLQRVPKKRGPKMKKKWNVEVTTVDEDGNPVKQTKSLEGGASKSRRKRSETSIGKKVIKRPKADAENSTNDDGSTTLEFPCTEDGCIKVFVNELQRNVHHRRAHLGDANPFHCTTEGCDKKFKSAHLLRDHDVTHRNERNFICETCGFATYSRSALRTHTKIHTFQPHPCAGCGDLLESLGAVKRHRLEHANKLKFCPVCEKSFRYQHTLNIHLRRHPELGIPLIECTICDKKFLSEKNLRNHQSIVHMGVAKHKCSFDNCKYITNGPAQLLLHEKLHMDSFDHLCDHCGKGFKSKTGLASHVQMAHKTTLPGLRFYKNLDPSVRVSRKIICEICGRAMASVSSLKQHKLIHTGEKPYECDLCHKSFRVRQQLLTHKDVRHADLEARRFRCDQCHLAFYSKLRLQCHITYVHEGVKKFKCDYSNCSASFTSAANRKKHVNVAHLGQRVTCHLCGKTLSGKYLLEPHLRVHRGEKPYAEMGRRRKKRREELMASRSRRMTQDYEDSDSNEENDWNES